MTVEGGTQLEGELVVKGTTFLGASKNKKYRNRDVIDGTLVVEGQAVLTEQTTIADANLFVKDIDNENVFEISDDLTEETLRGVSRNTDRKNRGGGCKRVWAHCDKHIVGKKGSCVTRFFDYLTPLNIGDDLNLFKIRIPNAAASGDKPFTCFIKIMYMADAFSGATFLASGLYEANMVIIVRGSASSSATCSFQYGNHSSHNPTTGSTKQKLVRFIDPEYDTGKKEFLIKVSNTAGEDKLDGKTFTPVGRLRNQIVYAEFIVNYNRKHFWED